MPYLSAFSYCMRVFIKEVPDDWVCEICNPVNIDSTSFDYVEDKSGPRYTGFDSDSSDRMGNQNRRSTSPYKILKSGPQPCSRSHKVGGTGKVKFIPEEEAIRLCAGKASSKSVYVNPSMHKMNAQSTKVSAKVSSMNVKRNFFTSPVGHGKLPAHNAKVSSMNVKPNSSPSLVDHGKLPRHSGVQKTSSIQQSPHSLAKGNILDCLCLSSSLIHCLKESLGTNRHMQDM